MTDLSVEDFDVLERGRPQTVSMFEKISIPSATSMRNSLTIPRDVATNHFPANTRAFIIIIDDVHIQLQRTQAARMLVRQFIERHVEQFDLVALVTTSNQFGMVQDFTTDKARLLALVDRFTGLMPAGAASEDRAFLNDVYDAQATANAIARFARHLAHENRHRIALILVSEGIEYNIYDADDRRSVDVVRATDEAIKALRRANVTLYAIDPRGLASVEGDRLERFDTSADAPSRVRITTSVTAPGARERLALSLQSLTHMAERTGGFAAINTNDYHGAFTRIIEETGTYYLLAYYPNPVGRTGEFRDIEVKVRRPDVYVSARQGYVVNQTRNGQKNSESSGQPSTGHLLKVLASALPKPDLPLRVQTIPLHGDHGRARVQVIVEVPGREFFPGPNAKAVEQVQFGLLTIDERGRKENGMSARIELRLTADERERVKLTGVRWLTSLELWPGRYHFRIAAHAAIAGRTGSVFADLDVPRFGEDPVVSAIAVTSPPTTLAITAGALALLPQLPTPPTAARTFVLGDVIYATAEIYTQRLIHTPAEAIVLITRDAPGADRVFERRAPIVRSSSGRNHVVFSLPTEQLGQGHFVLQLELPAGIGSSSKAMRRTTEFDVIVNR